MLFPDRFLILTLGWVLVLGGNISELHATDPIQNPYHPAPVWKNWMEDPEPVTANGLVQMPDPSVRIFPEDPSAEEQAEGKIVKFRNTDWPGRKYAGLHETVFVTGDSFHTSVNSEVLGYSGNIVPLRWAPGNNAFRLIHVDAPTLQVGAQFRNASLSLQGENITDNFSMVSDIERNNYFANVLRSAPSHASYGSSISSVTDFFDNLLPSYLNTDGASGSAPPAYSRIIAAASYLPTETKRTLLRHGLHATAMMYGFKAALPYQTDYGHNIRHRVNYVGGGLSANTPTQIPPQYAMEHAQEVGQHYDPFRHFENMVRLFRGMTVVPPIAILQDLQILQGTEGFGTITGTAPLTSRVIRQQPNSAAQVRVSTAACYDVQGFPLDVRFEVISGNRGTTVVDEGDGNFLITVPWDASLPDHRTTVLMIANNGVYDSNPAAITFLRRDPTRTSIVTPRLPRPRGLRDSKVLAGTVETLELFSSASTPGVIDYFLWEGTSARLDGNRLVMAPPTDASPSVESVVAVADDTVTGNAASGARMTYRVVHTKADLQADRLAGFAPLTVQFNGAGSTDKDGNTVALSWDFADGTTSTQVSPTKTFSQPGIYEVRLTASGPLGIDTSTATIEVFPSPAGTNAWPLVLNNGWNASGINATVWQNSGVTMSGGNPRLNPNSGTASLTSVQNLQLPFYLELDFTFKRGGAVISICGQQLGHFTIPGESFAGNHSLDFAFQRQPVSLGSPPEFIAAFPDDSPVRTHSLRVFAEADPENPGRMRLSGRLVTAEGERTFRFGNLEILDNKLRLSGGTNPVVQFIPQRVQVWSPNVTATVNQPAIALFGEDGRLISDNADRDLWHAVTDTRFFGVAQTEGQQVTRTFSLVNRGNAPVNLTGSSPVTVVTPGNFTLVSPPGSASLPPGGSTDFGLRFTDNGAGYKSTRVSIPTTDPVRGTLTFPVSAFGFSPREIEVRGNGLRIDAGRTATHRADNTLMPNVEVGQSSERTFLIHNAGTQPLNLSTPTLSGDGHFSLVQAPRSEVGPGGSTAMIVRYAPTSPGNHSVVVQIPNDDADEGGMNFTLSGTASAAGVRTPELRFNGEPLASGQAAPVSGMDFGSCSIGDTVLRSFELSSPDANVRILSTTWTGSSAFSAQQDLPGLVTPARRGLLRIAYSPTAVGEDQAILTITTDSVTHPTLTFVLRGQGVVAPILSVTENGQTVSHPENAMERLHQSSFGTIKRGTMSVRTFQIANTAAEAVLEVTGVTFSGPDAASFSVVSPLPISLQPGQTASLEVVGQALEIGALEAVMHIVTNSAGNNPFSIQLTGEVPLFFPQPMPLPDFSARFLSAAGLAADFDQDGRLDIALQARSAVGGYFNGSATDPGVASPAGVFRNTPSGLQRMPGFPLLNQHSGQVGWADFDGDGKLDVFSAGSTESANSAIYNTANNNAYFRNAGYKAFHYFNGESFARDTIEALGSLGAVALNQFFGRVAVGDYNNDGREDVFFVGRTVGFGSESIPILYTNEGSRQFAVRTSQIPIADITSGSEYYGPSSVEWYDMDGDGDLDLVTTGHSDLPDGSRPGQVIVWRNNGDESFAILSTLSKNTAEIYSATADFDGDGDFDVVVLHRAGEVTAPSLTMYWNDGSGQLLEGPSWSANSEGNLIACDFDHDGRVDVVDSSGTLYRNLGGGSFVVDSAKACDRDPIAGDFDGDGDVDLLSHSPTVGTTVLSLYENTSAVGNAPPEYPLDLQASVSGSRVDISWQPPSDDTTPSVALTYRVRIGTTPGADDVVPAYANGVTGRRYLAASGQFSQPSWSYNLPPGNYYVAVQAIDASWVGGVWSPERIVTVGSVTPSANAAPAAADDSFTVTNGRPTILPVLDNDSDPDGQLVYISDLTQPASGGSVAIQGRTVRFTPQAGFFGNVTFTYRAFDGTLASNNTATVTVTVGNFPPVASAGPELTADPGSTLQLLGAATDSDSVDLSYAWTQISGPETVNIVGPNTLTPSITPTLPGEYVFELAVTADGLTTRSEVRVVVRGIGTLYWGGGIANLEGVSVDARAATATNLAGTWNATTRNWNSDFSATSGYAAWSGNATAGFRMRQASSTNQSPDIALSGNVSATGLLFDFINGSNNTQLDLLSSDSESRVLTLTGTSPEITILAPQAATFPAFRRAGHVSGRGAGLLGGQNGFVLNGRSSATPPAPSLTPTLLVESSSISGPVRVNSGTLSIGSTAANATGLASADSVAAVGALSAVRVNYGTTNESRLGDTADVILAGGLFSLSVAQDTFAPTEVIGRLILDGSGTLTPHLGRAGNTQTAQLQLANGLDRGATGRGVLVVNGTTFGGLGNVPGGLRVTNHHLGAGNHLPWAFSFGRGRMLDGTLAGNTTVGFLATDSNGELLIQTSVAGNPDLGHSSWTAYQNSSDVALEGVTLTGNLTANATLRSLALSPSASSTLGLGGRQLTLGSLGFAATGTQNLLVGAADVNRGTLTSPGAELYLLHRRGSATTSSTLTVNSLITGGMDVILGGFNAQIQIGAANTFTGGTFLSGGTVTLAGASNVLTGGFPQSSAIHVSPATTLVATAGPWVVGGSQPQVLSGGDHIPGSGNVRADTRVVTISAGSTLSPGDTVSQAPFSFAFTTGRLNFVAGSKVELDLAEVGRSDRVVFVGAAGDYLAGSQSPDLVLRLRPGFDYSKTYPIIENVTSQGFRFASVSGYDTSAYTARVDRTGDRYVLSFAPIPSMVTTAPGSPRVSLLRNGLAINNGQTEVVGGIQVGADATFSYQIDNTGSANLSVASLEVTGAQGASVSIVSQATGIVAPGASRSFDLVVTPTAHGPWSANLRLATNDPANGELAWQISGTGWSAFDAWSASVNWSGKDSSAQADADGDGMSNFLEFALGIDPLVGGASPLQFDSNETQLILRYPRARADLTYVVETSTSLAPGSWTTQGVVQDTTTPVGGTATATIPFNPATEPRKFLRLRVLE